MAVSERWLEGELSENPGNEDLPLEKLLSGLLKALIDEQKEFE